MRYAIIYNVEYIVDVTRISYSYTRTHTHTRTDSLVGDIERALNTQRAPW